MEYLIIFGGMCGIAIIAAIVAAVSSVVSTVAAITKEDGSEE